MNLTDRIYLAVHIALTLLIVARHGSVEHWPYLIAWNMTAVLAIVILTRMRQRNTVFAFAHNFLPGFIFFTTVFEEVAALCHTVVNHWQNHHILALEHSLFPVPPGLWLQSHLPGWGAEFLQFGYFAFYPMYPVVALILWDRRNRLQYHHAFRDTTDALAIGYLICYAIFIAFPTQSPLHAGHISPRKLAGPFGWLISLIQRNGGVHGNAFPSAHIMLAFVILMFVWRYWPKVTPWLLVINLLMCLGAIYDGYHYAIDVIAGAILGSAVGASYLRHAARKTAP